MQQVNLLPQKAQTNGALLHNTTVLIGIAVVALLLLMTGAESYSLSQLRQQYQELEQQLQTSTDHLTDLQARFSGNTLDNSLLDELQRTQKRYQSLSQIVELLGDDQSDRTQGFSRYFSALAEQAQRDVWLTRIQIDSTHNDISMQGSAFQPELIPALLQRLKNSTAFTGRHFARLLIQQNPNQDRQADFSVSSNLKDEKEAENAR